MRAAKKNTRKGFILFASLVTALFLILVFQASFQSVVLTMHIERSDEVINQMECTAKTALYRAIDKNSSISGTFPNGDYQYNVQKSGESYIVTVSHGTNSVSFRALVFAKPNGKKVVYLWQRIKKDSH